MISYLLSGPAEEPVALAEAKAWLRVDGDDEDGLIATLVTAARVHVESVTGRALVTQSWRLVLDAWPADRMVRLPVAPLQSLTAIRAFDDLDDEHTVPLAQFTAETAVTPARLLLPATVATLDDDFGYLKSVVLTLQHHRPWTDHFLEPWSASHSLLAALAYRLTGSFALATYGLSALYAALSFATVTLLLRARSLGPAAALTGAALLSRCVPSLAGVALLAGQ